VFRVSVLTLLSCVVAASVATAADQPGMCKVAAVAEPAAGGAMKAADQCLAQATAATDKALAYHLKARALLWSGSTDWPAIVDASTKALQLNKSEPWPHLVRGQAHLRAGSVDLATKDLKVALDSKAAQNDDARQPRLEWIAALVAKGDWKAAQAEALSLFELVPMESQAWAIAYVTAARAGDKAAGSALISQAVSWPAKAYGSQIVAMIMGQITPDEAVVRAISVRADDAKGSVCRTNFYAGELYMIKGDKVSAKKHFEAAAATGAVAYPEYAMALAELRGL
jgi:hypothetical protein